MCGGQTIEIHSQEYCVEVRELKYAARSSVLKKQLKFTARNDL
jgi:hypothetical protein